MLDVSFSELVIIGIVALVVIGPERLPKVARTAGHLLGRLQRYVNDVKADINREIQLEELKKMQSDFQDAARDFEMNVRGEAQKIEEAVGQHVASAKGAVEDLAAQVVPIGEPPVGDVAGDVIPRPEPAAQDPAPVTAPTPVVAAASEPAVPPATTPAPSATPAVPSVPAPAQTTDKA